MTSTHHPRPCALCGAPARPRLVARDRNREIDHESFEYLECTECGVVQLSDPPADLGRYYAGEYHGMPSVEELDLRADFDRPKVDLISAHVTPGRLVEIGPSWGGFARYAKLAGYEVTGIELDPACCRFLEEVIGVRAVESGAPEAELPRLPASKVVAMWHALEHLPHPWRVLDAAAANLEPGGLLAIAVPNPRSLQFGLLGRRWAHLDAPRHLWLIPHATLVARAARSGLELVQTVTDDPFGRHCNRFGWEYALRRRPALGPSPAPIRRASQIIEKALAPLERSDLRGAAYTALFRRTT